MQGLNQKMNLILNFLLSSEAASRKYGLEVNKTKADEKNANNETVELWDLLKKTQSKVYSIENEINRVETENIHQGWDFRTQNNITKKVHGKVDSCERSRTGRTNRSLEEKYLFSGFLPRIC